MRPLAFLFALMLPLSSGLSRAHAEVFVFAQETMVEHPAPVLAWAIGVLFTLAILSIVCVPSRKG
jgi:hypothetical protein